MHPGFFAINNCARQKHWVFMTCFQDMVQICKIVVATVRIFCVKNLKRAQRRQSLKGIQLLILDDGFHTRNIVWSCHRCEDRAKGFSERISQPIINKAAIKFQILNQTREGLADFEFRQQEHGEKMSVVIFRQAVLVIDDNRPGILKKNRNGLVSMLSDAKKFFLWKFVGKKPDVFERLLNVHDLSFVGMSWPLPRHPCRGEREGNKRSALRLSTTNCNSWRLSRPQS